MTETQKFIQTIQSWLFEAADVIRMNLESALTVQQKNGRTDLVTNMDEQTQEFLMNKIQTNFPEDQILGEEKGYNTLKSFAGRVWIIDPIDGTMNFVMERENFCIMLAVYEDGIGKLGFIYDVMREELYWGGKGLGVYRNKSAYYESLGRWIMGHECLHAWKKYSSRNGNRTSKHGRAY